MGFKLKAPYRIDWTSIFRLGDDEGLGINGVTTNTGNIILNKNICDPDQLENTISHEMVHVEQWVKNEWSGDGEKEAEKRQYKLADKYYWFSSKERILL